MRSFAETLLLTLLITITATTAIPLSPPSDQHPPSNPAAKEPACASPKIKKCCTALNKPAKAVTDVLDDALSALNGLSITSDLGISCMFFSFRSFLFVRLCLGLGGR